MESVIAGNTPSSPSARVFWVVHETSVTKFDASSCRDWDDVARAAHTALGLGSDLPAAGLALRPSSSRGDFFRASDPVPADFAAPASDPLVVTRRGARVVGAGRPATALPRVLIDQFRERALFSTAWVLHREQGGIVVTTLDGAARAVAKDVAASIDDVREAFLSPEKRVAWDKFVGELRLVREVAADEMEGPEAEALRATAARAYLAHVKTTTMLVPFRRDFSLLVYERRESNGGITILTKSCETVEIREEYGFTRGAMNDSGLLIEPSDKPGHCNITFVINIDIGGWWFKSLAERYVSPDWPWQLYYLVQFLQSTKCTPLPPAVASPTSLVSPTGPAAAVCASPASQMSLAPSSPQSGAAREASAVSGSASAGVGGATGAYIMMAAWTIPDDMEARRALAERNDLEIRALSDELAGLESTIEELKHQLAMSPEPMNTDMTAPPPPRKSARTTRHSRASASASRDDSDEDYVEEGGGSGAQGEEQDDGEGEELSDYDPSSRGRNRYWTREEHDKFVEFVTRIGAKQCRTHAQKYFLAIKKNKEMLAKGIPKDQKAKH
eukprot:m51a1_g4126 hypothetical protein (558) ;mRNA; f:168717-171937